MARTTTTTTTTDHAALAADMVTRYATATGPAKTAVRGEAQAAINAAVDRLDVDAMQAYKAALDAMVPNKPVAAPVDYEALVARRIATLRTAAEALANGSVRPAGIPDDVTLDVDRIATLLDEATHDDYAADADRIAAERVSRSTGERGSIHAAVVRAFEASDGADALTIAEVTRLGATDDYKPGSGAVAARYFTSEGSRGERDGFVGIDGTATEPRRIARV